MRKILFIIGLFVFILSSCSERLEVEVSYETNGGSTINSMIFNEESPFTLPNDPVKEGYTFSGWFLDATFDTPFSVEGVIALEPEDNLTVYAQWSINTYTITFDSDGGSEVDSITQDYNTSISTPTPPTKEGYTFLGWDNTIPSTMPAESLTFTALWEVNTYTITFDSDGGSEVDSITQDYNTSISTPTPPTKEGYTFLGWDNTIPSTMPAESLTFTALWEVNTYTITFDSDGGSEVDSITQDYNTSISTPTPPTKEGYTFLGWDNTIPSTMPAESLTFTALWEVNTYTITFDSDGGSEVDSITQDYNTSISTPTPPTKEGYTFLGWDNTIPSTMPAESLTFTALWEVNTYTITFDSDGGSEVDSITQDYNTSISTPTPPTKEGYTFLGWDNTIPSTMPAESLTFTALWEVNTYTITFDSDGGSEVDSITQDYNTSISTPTPPTKEGYTFLGWDNTIPSTMPAESLTFTALWEVNTYTITFDSDGGSEVDSITQDYNTSISTPTPPTKEGYTFLGWDNTIPSTMPAESLTFTALWEVNTYTITFDSDGGSEVDSITQDYNTSISTPTPPTKEGYTFLGWDNTIPSTMPAESLTFTALWEVNTYTITFDSDGGSEVDSITQDYNTSISTPTPPTKEGYTFLGWDNTIPSTMPAESLTFTALWEVNTYTITFDSDGGSEVDSITQDYNTSISTPTPPTKEGYTFLGWDNTIPSTMPAESLTFTALWEVNTYTITFDSDGGSEVDSITQDYNTSISTPTPPTKEGYTFLGWDNTIPSTMPAESLTFTALWEVNTYTITFDSDGGSEVDSITQDYNTSISTPTPPTKEGYTFLGWDNTIPSTMPAESLTFTALWEVNTYTITFDSDGGSEVDSITQDYNTSISTPTPPTKEGYTFLGWDNTIPSTMPAESLTFTALWEVNTYTITFDSDGGSEVDSITQDYNTSISTPTPPTKEGYTFLGWDNTIPSTMPAESLTFTALWEVNTYTITFDSDGGSEVDSITQDYNTSISTPTPPTKEGYTFLGWDNTIPSTMPAESLTFTATWTIDLRTASIPFLSKHIQINQNFELPETVEIGVLNELKTIEVIWDIDVFSSSETGYFVISGSTEEYPNFIDYHFHVSILDEDKNIISGYVFGENKNDIRVVLSNNTNVWITSTDDSGFFQFINVENGLYVVRVDSVGYRSGEPLEINLNTSNASQNNRKNSTTQQRIEHISFYLEEISDSNYYYEWFFTGDVFGYETSVNPIEPLEIIVSDQPYVASDSQAALTLQIKFKQFLVNDDLDWTSEFASRMLEIFNRIPMTEGSAANKETVWILTQDYIEGDIEIAYGEDSNIARMSIHTFANATPRMATLEGIQGIYFSHRLYHAIVRFTTQEGSDLNEINHILKNRFGVEILNIDYESQTLLNESSDAYEQFKPYELLQLLEMFEEMPSGFHKINELTFLVRRKDGSKNPLYPEAPAIAWTSHGYIEFMESAFTENSVNDLHRLILHEKAHFMWEFLFSNELKETWIELGGWYETDETGSGWATTQTTEFVTYYAHLKNPDEDMAESISFYILNPNKLRAYAPDKYDFIEQNIMKGAKYLSIIREDLTFEVFNLYPDYDYPGKIIRVRTTVEGLPEEEKMLTVEIELNNESELFDGASKAYLRIYSVEDPSVFFDMYLHPINQEKNILRGTKIINKFFKSGYFTTDQIVVTDKNGNQRFEGQGSMGFKVYINNPLEDVTAPILNENSFNVEVDETQIDGNYLFIVEVSFEIIDENILDFNTAHIYINAEEDPSYSFQSWGNFNSDSGKVHIYFYFTHFHPNGYYNFGQIMMIDRGGNVTRLDLHLLEGFNDLHRFNLDTDNPDSTFPELDVNAITVTATPTNPETPNGETLVTITFFARDDLSGLGQVYFVLRDPLGNDFRQYFYHDNFYTTFFEGDANSWKEYTINITLPEGSAPGIWGLLEIYLEDKAGNFHTYNFLETVIFETLN